MSTFFTCGGLANGLAFAVEYAFRVSVEIPRTFVTRTPFRSIFVVFGVHRTSTRIKHGLGIAAFVDREQYGACIAPLRMVLYHKLTWIAYKCAMKK